jgi:signal transduction histidine kinase
VFLSTALGSLLAVAIVAPVTVILANRLARNQEDEHLRSAARTLAFELQVKHYDPLYAVADEIRELAQTAIVVALFEQQRLLAGKPDVPFVQPDSCRNKAHMRVCALAAGRWVVVAGRARTRLRAHADVTLLAAGVAVLVTAMLSLVLAFVLAAAAIRPLDKLSRALRDLPQRPHETFDLGPASDVHEVETLRASLHGVFETLRRALLLSHSFAGDAAHQLRTPLAALTAELDLALEVVDARARPYCLRAHAQATKLSRLIDRLLILAMPEDTIRAWVAVSSAELFEEALEALPPAARARIDCDGQVGFEADPILLTAALVAALEHALGIASGRLQLQAELEHAHARIVIAFTARPSAVSSGDDDMWRAVWRRVATLHGGRDAMDEARIAMVIPLHPGART